MIDLEIRELHFLRGPNIWANYPVFEAWVDLGSLRDASSDRVPGFAERIKRWFPSMIEHRCSVGTRGGFFQRLDRGTWPGHILEHVTLELQTLIGHNVGFGKAADTSVNGLYKVVVEYWDEVVAECALHRAREILLAAYAGREYDIASAISSLKDIADHSALGPSTKAIVDAAHQRRIPYRRLQKDCSLIQFGQGVHQRRIWTAESDRTGAIAEHIAQDKELTRTFLQKAGIPVARGRVVTTREDAWEAAEEIGLPVVIKPRDANHGRGVFINLTTQDLVGSSFDSASTEGSGVIVEKYIPGDEHRVLIIGDRLVAAIHGNPSVVTGNGRDTITGLVEGQLNATPLRGDSEECPWSSINTEEWNPVILYELSRQGYGPTSIPDMDERVLISHFAHNAINVSDMVHPQNREHLVNAAKVIGLDICGIDVVCSDIALPFEEQGGALIEVNASPSLLLHMKPTIDTNCPVGEAIMDMIYPQGAESRIPVFAVSGSSGKTATVELLTHLLAGTGKNIASSTSKGMQFGERFTPRSDGDRIAGAQGVLMHPSTEVAVCEASAPMVLIDGLGFDRCNVAVVLNVTPKDMGLCYLKNMDDVAKVHRCIVDVVLPQGTAILNADDPLVRNMATYCRGDVIYFSLNSQNPTFLAHCQQGHKGLCVANNAIHLCQGNQSIQLCPLSSLPHMPLDAILGAIGAAWSFNLPLNTIVDRVLTHVAKPAWF